MNQRSPYHPGERAIQARLGVRQRIEEVGRRIIRDHMPEQHRAFYRQLPLFFVGSAGDDLRPWASALHGPPGFVQSPDPRHLRVRARPIAGDPLAENLRDGAAIGGLGLEFHTRRRNRVNGKATLDADGGGFTLEVDQSFGNCPQYINTRRAPQSSIETTAGRATVAHRGETLDARERAIIAAADTFFIASRYVEDAADPAHGIDVSHRGGLPGFVELRGSRRLVWPDFRGNFAFNTLGNILLDPRAGLLFVDFASGATIQMTGAAEILWTFESANPAHAGAQRMIVFDIESVLRIDDALPPGWEFLTYAPQFAQETGQ
ncbi:MAG TPA: pyridoxamine 5'-phosphate oxidase family protein [Alphaproteobacteria bacterium]|nr:pyridoxamine 5'-phosphate oxidase family protein [Alphaproteobacteria bacterium]